MNLLPVLWRPQLDSIYAMDALLLMQACEDHSVDAIISDPPYNLTELAFEQAIDWPEFWKQARRIAKMPQTPVILFSQQPFTTDLINSNRRGFRYEIIMEKTMPTGFLDANRRPLRSHENILIFGDRLPAYAPVMEFSNVIRARSLKRDGTSGHYGKIRNSTWVDDGRRYPRSVWRFAQRKNAFSNTKTLHPTEKPLACLERLIRLYTRPGDVILDPFIGSGTTAVAARGLQRHFIGGDSSPDMIAGAQGRLHLPYMVDMFASLEKTA